MKRSWMSLAGLLLALCLMLAGCGSDTSSSTTSTSTSNEITIDAGTSVDKAIDFDDFTVSVTKAEVDNGQLEIDLAITNTSSAAINVSDSIESVSAKQGTEDLSMVDEAFYTQAEKYDDDNTIQANSVQDYDLEFALANTTDPVTLTITAGGISKDLTITL